MHRPFVRAAMVAVMLICGLTMHGWHADHAHRPTAAAAGAVHAAVPDVDSGTAVGGHTTPHSADQGTAGGHPPHGEGCGTGPSVNAAHAIVAPAMASTAAVLTDDGSTAMIGTPVVTYGRALLTLHCVSRT